MSKFVRKKLLFMQRACATTDEVRNILKHIKNGTYYDELTEDEKEAYSKYHNSDRRALEAMHRYFNGDLHFKLDKRRKMASDEEFRKNVQEVEEIMDAYTEEYNSPEAKAAREAEYQAMINRHNTAT